LVSLLMRDFARSPLPGRPSVPLRRLRGTTERIRIQALSSVVSRSYAQLGKSTTPLLK